MQSAISHSNFILLIASANFTIHKCCCCVNTLHKLVLSLSLCPALSAPYLALHYLIPVCALCLNLFENCLKICFVFWLLFLATSLYQKSHNSWRQTKCRQGQLVSLYMYVLYLNIHVHVCVYQSVLPEWRQANFDFKKKLNFLFAIKKAKCIDYGINSAR